MKPIILPEHLLLLAMGEEKGAVLPSSAVALPYGLNGALIMELSLRGRVVVKEDVLVELSTEPTGDDILDEALKTLEDCEREKSAEFWIARPDALVEGLKLRLLDRLVERGILKREERRFLWLIPYSRFPELDKRPERDLRQHIQDVVLHGADADEPTALLLSLVNACGLASEVFPDEDPAEIKEKIKAYSHGTQIGEAISSDVAAATMGAVTASIMATVVPTMDV